MTHQSLQTANIVFFMCVHQVFKIRYLTALLWTVTTQKKKNVQKCSLSLSFTTNATFVYVFVLHQFEEYT